QQRRLSREVQVPATFPSPPLARRAALSPCGIKCGRPVDAPGKQPDQMCAPEQIAGHLVVVAWIALTEEAQDVLVDEIEIEEPVNIVLRRDVADRMPLIGIMQASENVPGCGYREK